MPDQDLDRTVIIMRGFPGITVELQRPVQRKRFPPQAQHDRLAGRDAVQRFHGQDERLRRLKMTAVDDTHCRGLVHDHLTPYTLA